MNDWGLSAMERVVMKQELSIDLKIKNKNQIYALYETHYSLPES